MASDDLWSMHTLIKDMLFDSQLTYAEMAERLNISEYKLHKTIEKLGLGWVKKGKRKHMSRGQGALMNVMQRLLPNETIVNEHHVGEQLRLDIYCPSYNLGAEYHGRQHFQYSDFFHGSKDAFIDSQNRDIRKEELCKEQGIALIIFRFNDKLTEDIVFSRMLDAIRGTPLVGKDTYKSRYKGNDYYEDMKRKRRSYAKLQYREAKRLKDINGN